jgi:hypothetical protein
MRHVARGAMACAILISAGAMPCAAQEAKPAAKDAAPVVILNSQSAWRSFETLKRPVIQFDDGAKPIPSTHPWLDQETPAAPADWMTPEFSDSAWRRGPSQVFPRTPYVAGLCQRARFEVTDPAAVKDLRVSVAYYGGVIVYLNGQEITRANLPKDAIGPESLAEGYPPAAFVTDKGEIVPGGSMAERYKDALAARERKVTDLVLPAKALRKGVNVLAVEVIRSPYGKIIGEKTALSKDPRELKDRNCPYDLSWNTCEIRQVKLTASGPDGLVPNASRPKELQVWTSDLLAADTHSDFGDRCGTVGPVVIQGPRNGWSSGKIVLGSPKAIEGLKVTCGDLKQDAAIIPASRMRARYAVAFGNRADSPLDTLLETPLDSFPAENGSAVVPVWLTVQVPRDAKPGQYTGQVTVEIKNEKAITVPVSLEVADFAVPDTQDYRTFMELMQSPDTLAVEYNVPLWSEKHWASIADSMRYIGEIGSRVVHIPLIAQTNSGNEQSMVRFIPKADGTYDYDFTVMDRYLDAAEKNMGKPKFVAFIAWEIYLDTPKEEVKIDPNASDYIRMEKSWAAARWGLRGKGPFVTTFDPATKEVGTVNLPRFEDPAAKPIWKGLFDELHKRLAKRGLEKTMLLGMASDRWPSKEEMAVLQEVSGNLPWINHTHGGNHVGSKLDGMAAVAYTAFVWNVQYPQSVPMNATAPLGGNGSMYGWKRPELYTEFRRFGSLNDWPASTILLFPELQITGQQRGLGRVGADFWAALKDKSGQRRGRVWEKYPQSMWHSCNLASHMLVPGPTGPVASSRYEQMREGVQECEARIAIERILTDDKLKARIPLDLDTRCQKLLDDRVWQELKAFSSMQLTGRAYATATNCWYGDCGGLVGHLWYAGSGWQDRTQKLYDLAGEVRKAIAEK